MPQSGLVEFRPLYWPDGKKPPERWAIYCAFYAAIVVGFVAGFVFHAIWIALGLSAMFGLIAFHQRNGRDTVLRLAEQLQQRPTFPTNVWGSSERAGFAGMVGGIVADELAWPNPHFAPDDPLELVLYCPGGDGGEGLAISYNFEKSFGRRCEFPSVRTFGEFVDRNLRRPAAWSGFTVTVIP